MNTKNLEQLRRLTASANDQRGSCGVRNDVLLEILDDLIVLRGASVVVEVPAHELALRRLLWLRHGCEYNALYGDDAEMACGNCRMDFKRMTPAEMESAFIRQGEAEMLEKKR